MKLQTSLLMMFTLAAPALAQSTTVVTGGPSPNRLLRCPAGAVEEGGPRSTLEASVCVRSLPSGRRVYDGPFVAYWPSGVRQAEGQYREGARDGQWVFFDRNGVKTGETQFKAGDYHGLRVEFHANGQPSLEERYLEGFREGTARTFDERGRVLTTVEYRAGRAVTR